ncbi:MAG: toxin HicA [Propionibacteriaceae bacterium]|jgi:hypothetical protein|nr:toxin HicA [Propionibacteriaceae bacterium]
MDTVTAIEARMRKNPAGIRFADLARVCEHHFGQPTSRGTSHHVYSTPWHGDPRVNIQNDSGMAKAYQVRQVLKAINRIRAIDEEKDEDNG